MRGSTLSLLVMAFTLALPLSHAQAAGGVDEAKAGIAQSNAKWEAAVKAGDAAAIAALYTSDALVLAPDREMAKGRAGAEKVFSGMLKAA
jgi:ketosteroid isomerase-like protein